MAPMPAERDCVAYHHRDELAAKLTSIFGNSGCHHTVCLGGAITRFGHDKFSRSATLDNRLYMLREPSWAASVSNSPEFLCPKMPKTADEPPHVCRRPASHGSASCETTAPFRRTEIYSTNTSQRHSVGPKFSQSACQLRDWLKWSAISRMGFPVQSWLLAQQGMVRPIISAACGITWAAHRRSGHPRLL